MHIGVEATCWHNKRGYGRHARALLGHLVALDQANYYTLFSNSRRDMDSLPANVAVSLVNGVRPGDFGHSRNGRRPLAGLWRMSRALSGAGADLLLFPTIYTYVPVSSRARKIVMIHDIIAETYPHLTVPGRSARALWRAKVGLGRRQADAIVTVSDYSRQGLIAYFKLAPERVFVAGEASDPIFRPLPRPALTPHLRSLGLADGKRYIVYVGGFGPHKNLLTLLQVFHELAQRPSLDDIRLLFVGEYRNELFHTHYAALRQQIDDWSLADWVRFTGYLPDDDLVALLNISTVLVLPSLIEGFGLPAVEAAACGCPVIATRESPLPQLLGDGAIYIDPHDEDDLLQALARVLGDGELRRQMGQAGLKAAGALSWQAAARQMQAIIQRVAA